MMALLRAGLLRWRKRPSAQPSTLVQVVSGCPECRCGASGSLKVPAAGIAITFSTVAPQGDEQVAQQHGCQCPDDEQAAVANIRIADGPAGK